MSLLVAELCEECQTETWEMRPFYVQEGFQKPIPKPEQQSHHQRRHTHTHTPLVHTKEVK